MQQLSLDTTTAFLERFKIVDDLSIEEVEESYLKYFDSYRLTPTGRREQDTGTTMASCAIGDVGLVCSRWGAPMIGTAHADEGNISIGIPVTGETSFHDFQFGRFEPNPFEARLFRYEFSLEGLGPRTVLDLVLPYKMIQDRAFSFYHNEQNEPLRFAPVLDLRSAGGQMIISLVEYMKRLMLDDPEGIKHPLVVTSLQEHLISTVLEVLPSNYSEPQAVAAPCAVPGSVRRAEEYMRTYADQPVTVEDLAVHAGCSERALHNAFRSFRQKSPMTVLRDLRLEGAHEDLKSGEAAIADIVSKWGFSNPGRFAKLYTEKFGRKPSETRRFGSV